LLTQKKLFKNNIYIYTAVVEGMFLDPTKWVDSTPFFFFSPLIWVPGGGLIALHLPPFSLL